MIKNKNINLRVLLKLLNKRRNYIKFGLFGSVMIFLYTTVAVIVNKYIKVSFKCGVHFKVLSNIILLFTYV